MAKEENKPTREETLIDLIWQYAQDLEESADTNERLGKDAAANVAELVYSKGDKEEEEIRKEYLYYKKHKEKAQVLRECALALREKIQKHRRS